jgi:adenylate cyclase
MQVGEAHEIVQWTVSEGLNGTPETNLLPGFAERLLEIGIPLLRANVYQPTLDPMIGGHLFIWLRGDAVARQEDWDRNVSQLRSEETLSPFDRMIFTDTRKLRRRLGGDEEAPRVDLFDQFVRIGGTDYFAMQTKFGTASSLGSADRILTSWLTDAPDGFSTAHLTTLEQVVPALALVAKASSTYRTANTVIETYLGKDAGQRVLRGAIDRGSGETIRTVLWYCDLKGFTKLADATPRDRLLAMLDDYFETMVTTVQEFGGQVLKFMGDGLLAIFNLDDDTASCMAALNAAENALDRVEKLTAARRTSGLPVSEFSIGLHLGDVMYGNIGARNRLDFTVVGPAVNEASRIEALSRGLEQDLVISSAFAAAAKGSTDRLVSLGRYALRGVRKPQELFTLEMPEGGG